ncbi:hypothetical protein CC1G_06750 [Coprinopsis cinerea okayama7|uniref:Uncharacterized protein n=1 Tax=Coprinopsis cinerea (strain Okayama-7 / 130 / ATCC MYA-4618 / FGSC 9003) TaxID=240176 RepID=A8N1I4_COPC7|nr:hypothetical protein CC1G_06750 [Coprinopsis cinerea okayama7\|eukprot:XP_001828764.2 hypothetical protein CC1G_06750 [Coprinopsis cinerea okayama7\
MSMSSVSPEPDDVADSSPGWYLKDGPHRYVGVILVVVMVTIVIGIYLHVGRRPRQLAQALRQRLRRTGEKETASIPAINIISTDNEKRVYEHSHPSTISTSKPSASERPRSYQIAPEQVWMPEKPAPCVKQSMRMTVEFDEFDWGHVEALKRPLYPQQDRKSYPPLGHKHPPRRHHRKISHL